MHDIEEFLDQKSLAVVGASRSGKKFGNIAIRELLANGYRLFPVHPAATVIEGLDCYPSLRAIPLPVGGVLISVHPEDTQRVVEDAASAGIHRVWMIQGSSSPHVLTFCKEHRMTEVHGACILLFLEKSKGIHRFHRWFLKIFRRLPR